MNGTLASAILVNHSASPRIENVKFCTDSAVIIVRYGLKEHSDWYPKRFVVEQDGSGGSMARGGVVCAE